jgi:hypothetical protein
MWLRRTVSPMPAGTQRRRRRLSWRENGPMILCFESRKRTRPCREQGNADRADVEESLQDSREQLVRYQILLAQLKETLARA